MKKILIPALTAALLCSSAFALENSVAPKVTDIKNHSPKTGLIVGNSYSFYNCGVHGYLRGLTRENKQDWKARIVTISSGRLSYHDVEQYMGPHEMDPYVKKDEKGNLINPMFDVVILQGMSTEPIAEKSIPTFKKFLKQHVAQLRQKEPNRLWLIPGLVRTSPKTLRNWQIQSFQRPMKVMRSFYRSDWPLPKV